MKEGYIIEKRSSIVDRAGEGYKIISGIETWFWNYGFWVAIESAKLFESEEEAQQVVSKIKETPGIYKIEKVFIV